MPEQVTKYPHHQYIYIGGSPDRTTYYGHAWNTDRYRRVIANLLNMIWDTESGKVLFDAIWKRTLVTPVLEHADADDRSGKVSAINSMEDIDYVRNANNISSLKLGFHEEAFWDADAELNGKGTETVIEFTPGFFDRASPIAQAFAGEFRTDVLLFHELVHASRASRGVVDSRKPTGSLPIGDMSRYTSHEEFIAIMLANVYRSEKYNTLNLRASHANVFERYRNPKGFANVLEFQGMMDLFFAQSPSLARGFARRVNAAWNPIRDYYS